MVDDGYRGYQGWAPVGSDPPGWVDGAPTSGEGQSCAFCRSESVQWVHPLAADRVAFRVYGKGHTLPTFWTLCDRCERVYASADDDAAVAIMTATGGWQLPDPGDVDELVRQPLTVFRRADKGARRLR